MRSSQWMLMTLLAATIPLMAAQMDINSINNFQNGKPFPVLQGSVKTIIEFVNSQRVKTLFKECKAIINTIINDALDFLTFLLATSSTCEGKQEGPMQKLLKNVPRLITNLLAGRWRIVGESFPRIFSGIIGLVKNIYVKLTALQKLIKFLVSLFTNIGKLFMLFFKFAFSSEPL